MKTYAEQQGSLLQPLQFFMVRVMLQFSQVKHPLCQYQQNIAKQQHEYMHVRQGIPNLSSATYFANEKDTCGTITLSRQFSFSIGQTVFVQRAHRGFILGAQFLTIDNQACLLTPLNSPTSQNSLLRTLRFITKSGNVRCDSGRSFAHPPAIANRFTHIRGCVSDIKHGGRWRRLGSGASGTSFLEIVHSLTNKSYKVPFRDLTQSDLVLICLFLRERVICSVLISAKSLNCRRVFAKIFCRCHVVCTITLFLPGYLKTHRVYSSALPESTHINTKNGR